MTRERRRESERVAVAVAVVCHNGQHGTVNHYDCPFISARTGYISL